MILRVPDYYGDFSCIADRCQDSCCIGWEIDIDEDTHDFYQSVEGPLQERFTKYMYEIEDGVYSLELKEHGRCPFLNSTNLCDICIHLGEEALSEVCTEYPRFAIEYGDVLQKCLSLSCEEVGRLVFTRESSVEIVDIEQADLEYEAEVDYETEVDYEADAEYEADADYETDADYEADVEYESDVEYEAEDGCQLEYELEDYEDESEIIAGYEGLQNMLMDILHDSEKTIADRIVDYLLVLEKFKEGCQADAQEKVKEGGREDGQEISRLARERFMIFQDMEVLNDEWTRARDELVETLGFGEVHSEANASSDNKEISDPGDDKYLQILGAYMHSPDYKELDYEQLMVYFTFRYMMNSVYNFDHKSYGRLAVVFTLVIRDMAAVRFHRNGGHFSRADMIDVARIFSKEVEHSEDNVELAREAFLFDQVFTVENLLKQV